MGTLRKTTTTPNNRSAAGLAIAVLLASAVFAALFPAVSADALPYELDAVPTGGANGRVLDIEVVGDQLWAGGMFTQARKPDTSWAANRNHLAVFDLNTGALLDIGADANGTVNAIEFDGETTVWVAGEFSSIGGVTTDVAAFDAETGDMRTDFVVDVGGSVDDLMFLDGRLYLAGNFNRVQDAGVSHLTRIDPTTRQVDPAFAPTLNGPVREIAAWDTTVYAVGSFSSVGSGGNAQTRYGVSGFQTGNGAPAGPNFSGLATNGRRLRTMAISDDGAMLFVGDEDRANSVTAFDRVGGTLRWTRPGEGDIQALAASPGRVLVGTHDGWARPSDEWLLVSLDSATGNADSGWRPILDPDFMGVYDILVGPDYLAAAGEFTEINGVPVRRIGMWRTSDWQPTPPLVPPVATGNVNCDEALDDADALNVLEYLVGLRSGHSGCPLAAPADEIDTDQADISADDAITIMDSWLVLICANDPAGTGCPAPTAGG